MRSPVEMQALTAILRTHGETRALRIDAAPGTLRLAPAVDVSSQTQYLGDDYGFMTYRLSVVELR